MKTVSILGSTGSIGINSLKVYENLKSRFKLETITANRSIDKLIEQAKTYFPKRVIIGEESLFNDLKRELSSFPIEVLAGYNEIVSHAGESDVVLNGLVGYAGLRPSFEAIKNGKILALANKESLVMAGEILKREAKSSGAKILPVDSEHSAIFQSLNGEDYSKIKKIVLTASGGPFFKRDINLDEVTPKEALKHPNWAMGQKISIDSATMINKGLELIEAVHLFDIDESKIDVLIHPQSIVHSMVEYIDSSFIAQLGIADMRIPIQYALTYPERFPLNLPQLDLANIGNLQFFKPDNRRFPSIDLSREAIRAKGTMPVVLNVVNEASVYKFLDGKIKFTDIVKNCEKAMENHKNILDPDIESVLELNCQLLEEFK
ncbi:MAG: 1-deoxy-D-xylulose-5-phosphate reductoisomerase [Candidatus Cloacimonadota bacterium]|nr:MAG: 1-deoxy-D-xylulose-5-phosphate reductoisomerase [Candidatus Cloacimonadota bacterium]PIE78479.1 MAG: 1-deoxy-D-xylulose-5-phosphate reductoisomerase [Candidatus Delongbacteria bacterium]